MKKAIILSTLALISTTVFANSIDEGLSTCRFSSKSAAIDFARALDGSSKASYRLSQDDRDQVEACSTAMTMAISEGVSYEELSMQLVTDRNHIQNGRELRIDLYGKDRFKVEKNKLIGTKSSVEAKINMLINTYGEINHIQQNLPEEIDDNQMGMEVISKNEVRLTHKISKLDTVVKAKIKKSILGKIKSISISSSELENALRPTLEAKGMLFAKGFEMNTKDVSFSMDYEISGMECEIDKLSEELECLSSFKFELAAKF